MIPMVQALDPWGLGIHTAVDQSAFPPFFPEPENWQVISGQDQWLSIDKLEHVQQNLELISFDQICDRPIVEEQWWKLSRKNTWDIIIPGIVSPLPNPCNLPYRLIDGNHRLAKMKVFYQMNQAYMWVIPRLIIQPFFTSIEPSLCYLNVW